MIEEKETKRKKVQIKTELLYPGIYADEQMVVYQAKRSKIRKISRKLPPTINEEYDRKIFHFEDKLSKQETERQSLIRQQSKTPNKKEILNKIINQIQSHLAAKEQELFDKHHCDTPVALLDKKKSQFFQARSHLELLEKMGSKIEDKKVEFQRQRQSSQQQLNNYSYTPRAGQIRSQSVEMSGKVNKPKVHQSDRIQRIQGNVNKEMEKLGLKSFNISPDSLYELEKEKPKMAHKSLSQQFIKKAKTFATHRYSQSNNLSNMINPHVTQASLFKRFHLNLKIDQDEQKPQDIESVIKYCNTERSALKTLTKDIAKNRRVQFRKFRIIQKELSTVGELGFEGLKNKYLVQ